MDKIHQLKNMLWSELDEITSKGEMTLTDLECVQKITSSLKNLDKIDTVESHHITETPTLEDNIMRMMDDSRLTLEERNSLRQVMEILRN